MSFPVARVAHRGASAECPENTLMAFRRAIEIGVDGLELDVHLTRDDALVVMHDPTLERTTNGTGRILERTLAEIRQLDAGRGEKVPTLAEVFQLVRSTPIWLYIEVKGEDQPGEVRIAEAVVKAIETEGFLERSVVTSFSSAALLRSKALQPALPTMLDPSPQDGSLTPRQMAEQALRAGANCVAYDYSVVTPDVARMTRLCGLALWPWVPDSAAESRDMIRLGAAGLMTDRPEVLNRVLSEFAI